MSARFHAPSPPSPSPPAPLATAARSNDLSVHASTAPPATSTESSHSRYRSMPEVMASKLARNSASDSTISRSPERRPRKHAGNTISCERSHASSSRTTGNRSPAASTLLVAVDHTSTPKLSLARLTRSPDTSASDSSSSSAAVAGGDMSNADLVTAAQYCTKRMWSSSRSKLRQLGPKHSSGTTPSARTASRTRGGT